MKSLYGDPEYQKKVSLQMLATPTHEIACRAIVVLMEKVKSLELAHATLLKDSQKAFFDIASMWQNAIHDLYELRKGPYESDDEWVVRLIEKLKG